MVTGMPPWVRFIVGGWRRYSAPVLSASTFAGFMRRGLWPAGSSNRNTVLWLMVLARTAPGAVGTAPPVSGTSMRPVVEKPSRVASPAAAAPNAGTFRTKKRLPLVPATGRVPSRRKSDGSGIWPEPESVRGVTAGAGAIPKVAMLAVSACGKAESTAA